MAGLQGRVQMVKGLQDHIRLVGKMVDGHAQEAAIDAGIEGLATARMVVATTPSSLSSTPKNNRIWTGKMISELDSDVKRTGTTITVRVGWLQHKLGYFLVQEEGGTVRNIVVTPMNALGQARQVMVKRLADRDIT